MLLATQIDPDGRPFIVPAHSHQLTQCAGKVAGTVLTLERQIANFAICEWSEEWSWQRKWCYDTLDVAWVALAIFLDDAEATEPVAWVRAFDGNGIRRQSHEEANAQFGTALLRWAEDVTDG